MWKGDDVGLTAIHSWIKRKLGNPMKCDICGSTSKKRYDWSNKDHKYSRNKDDWQRLCVSCHRKFDNKFNNKKNEQL